MIKIAIIGASYLQEPLVNKAKQLGYYTICFAWAEGATCASICDKFYDISIVEKDRILRICQEEEIDGIVTIASDVAAPTVAYIANKLGLVGNCYEAAVRANNKYLMREALTDAGVLCPKYFMVTPATINSQAVHDNLQSLLYPIIVKPTDRSGSLGVTKVMYPRDLYFAVNYAMEKSFKHEAMIEEYIEGREISVEFISFNGKHYPLQITDKVTTEAPHFVELEHHQPSTLSTEQFEEIYSITAKALDALGISNGASHSEYKITKSGSIFVMEIGGRMGGDFIGSDLVQLSTGYDYVKGVIDVCLGQFHEPKLPLHNYSGVYFLSKETKRILPIIEHCELYPEIVKAHITDSVLRELSCSSDRSGYAIYQSDKKILVGDADN